MRRAAGIAGALVIVGAFVVALALAPVSAQQHPASPKQSGGGALAGADYQCVLGQFIGHTDLQADQPPLNFKPSQGGVTFGSSISTAGTPPFSSFTLQPGIYQIHLSTGPATVQDPMFLPFPNSTPAGEVYLQANLNGTSLGGVRWPMLVRAGVQDGEKVRAEASMFIDPIITRTLEHQQLVKHTRAMQMKHGFAVKYSLDLLGVLRKATLRKERVEVSPSRAPIALRA